LNGLSETAFFLTIYEYVLNKYSNQQNIYTSILNSNRKNHYIENIIGMFVTTQPVLLNYSHNKKSFKKLLKENINNIRNIYNFEYYSFTEIKNELNLKNINNAFIYHSKSILNHLIDKENNMFLTERKTNSNLLNLNDLGLSLQKLCLGLVLDKGCYSDSISTN